MHYLILLALLFAPHRDTAATAQLKKELSNQHFSGTLHGDVKFTTLGRLSCGNASFRVVFYEWQETSPPGAAVHASYRIVLMRGTTYLGSYAVADKPVVYEGELKFPNMRNGNSIKCDDDGALPKRVLVDGEIVGLAK